MENATIQKELLKSNYHPWGVFLTVLGTILLDFNADGCQSPTRAFLLDISIQGIYNKKICNYHSWILCSFFLEDHAKGLSTFTIMAGFGGFFGYALGGIDWDSTVIGM